MGLFSEILKKPFVKVSSLNGLSVLVRIFTGFLSAKAIAYFVGPAGMGLVGNLRNLLGGAEFFSTLGMQNGVIKYTAEYAEDKKKLHEMLTTVMLTLLLACIILSVVLFSLSDFIAGLVFKSSDYNWIIKLLSVSLPWYGASYILVAVLNGLGDYKQVITINIAGNISAVALSVLLMWQYHTTGAIIGLVSAQLLLFIFSVYPVTKKIPLSFCFNTRNYNFAMLRLLLSYSLMTVVSAISIMVVYIAIRNKIAEVHSNDAAGFYEAINRISSFYMMFASTMLTVYFFPKLSAAVTLDETRQTIKGYYKTMLPLFAVGFVVLYFLRELVVLVLLKDDFLPVSNLFFWQLLGDFFKVGSLILGFQFFAKKLISAFIITEILSLSILYFSAMFFIDIYGVEGAIIAHAVTFFLYWVVLSVYFRKLVF